MADRVVPSSHLDDDSKESILSDLDLTTPTVESSQDESLNIVDNHSFGTMLQQRLNSIDKKLEDLSSLIESIVSGGTNNKLDKSSEKHESMVDISEIPESVVEARAALDEFLRYLRGQGVSDEYINQNINFKVYFPYFGQDEDRRREYDREASIQRCRYNPYEEFFSYSGNGYSAESPEEELTLDLSGMGLKGVLSLPSQMNIWVLNCTENPELIGIANLPSSLKLLNCMYNNIKALPEPPEGLEELNCSYNPQLTDLPKLPDSLTELDCRGCSLTQAAIANIRKQQTRIGFRFLV